MSSIRLSQKHGVNPSLDQCFYCMKDKGVVLFGALRGDAEAPRRVCLDHEPCSECAALMEAGVILISVDEQKTDDPKNPYRSGGWCVVKDAAIRRMVTREELAADILKRRIAFVPDDAWDALGLPRGAS